MNYLSLFMVISCITSHPDTTEVVDIELEVVVPIQESEPFIMPNDQLEYEEEVPTSCRQI